MDISLCTLCSNLHYFFLFFIIVTLLTIPDYYIFVNASNYNKLKLCDGIIIYSTLIKLLFANNVSTSISSCKYYILVYT